MNKIFRSVLFLAVMVAALLTVVPAAYQAAGLAGGIAAYLLVNALGAGLMKPAKFRGMALAPTFTVTELLNDVIDSFLAEFPALQSMGMDFQPASLKLDKTYTAHIPSLPTIQSWNSSTGYGTSATDARGLFTDVDIKVSNHKFVPLKFLHLDAIKDDKAKYMKAIGNAGYVLAKAVIDDALAKCNSRNFSQESVYAVADSDLDAVENITGDMNLVKAYGKGRVMLINTGVATVLGADSRVASNLQYGQRTGGDAYRRFTNIGGFSEIVEYPDLPSNNGTALAAVTGVAATGVFTKVAHGLKTTDPVVFTTLTGGSSLTALTVKYFAIKVDADTFKVASTRDLAVAGTHLTLGSTVTDATVQLYEALSGFAFDMRALAFLGGIPDGMESQLAKELGIPAIASIKAVTHRGITMAAVGYQQSGTLDLYWAPVLVWGWRAGKDLPADGDGAASLAGALCDYAGHRLVTL